MTKFHHENNLPSKSEVFQSSECPVAGLTTNFEHLAFEAAFDAWVCSEAASKPALSDVTLAVQRSMWSAFGAWCIRTRTDAINLNSVELSNYLRSRVGSAPPSELTPRYSWRLITLVDRVLKFMAREQGKAPSRAAAQLLNSDFELKHANSESKDPLPEILTDSQDRQLVNFLEGSVSVDASSGSISLVSRWQDVRNRTGVALLRGAGLTPLEVRLLTVSSVVLDMKQSKGAWKVRAPATGSIQAHDAPVARWARHLLEYWLQLRSDLAIPGDWLLPSTMLGKQWGKTSQFNSVAEVLDSAGLSGFKGGGYRLRNTFAVRQLERPQCTEAKVAEWMGVDVREISRFRAVMVE